VTAYYKAVRCDSTDFRTGTFRYEVGQTVTHPCARRVRDDPSTYLSVSTVATDCTGMLWPCRLFEVRGIGRPLRASNLPNKRCFSALEVLAELPATDALGPQGVEIAALIERCATLTMAEARALGATWVATWDAARDARDAARDARDARVATWDAARVAAWVATRDAARVAAWVATRDAARDAAMGAALALVVRDLIPPEDFEVLFGPWRQVIERGDFGGGDQ
jgi:hypothetical protein